MSAPTAPPSSANSTGASATPSVTTSATRPQEATGQSAVPSASVVTTEPISFQPTDGRGADRPCIAMSLRLVRFYKQVNEAFFRNRRLEGAQPKYNDGYDDRDGHYIVIAGEEIMERYAVQDVLGRGSFGTVVKCLDSKRLETVALKITRNGRTFRNQAKQEIDILLKLSRIPGLTESYVARLLKVFEWKGHLCLAFDLLSLNLFQLIQCTRFNGVSIDLTRKFAFQILQVLHALQMHDPPIIHCDLKPENVLLRSNNRSGIRVIDFGSACYENRRLYRYIQSRFYRSPEVILGLDYTTAIDRWSLGAMLVELHTGTPLFDGRSEPQQLQRMVGLLGPLPYQMVHEGSKRDQFFLATKSATMPTYAEGVATPVAEIQHTTCPPGETATYWLDLPPARRHVRNLNQILGVNSGGPGGRRAGQPGHDLATYELFADFVTKLLKFDPKERMTVEEAMQHPFILPALQLQQLYAAEQSAAASAAPAAPGDGQQTQPPPPAS